MLDDNKADELIDLAWHEMRLLLATVVLHFDLKLLPESEKWNEQHVYTVSCSGLFKRTSQSRSANDGT